MNVAIVKYNAGNIYSVVNALRRLGITPVVTDNAEELMNADKVLFPGQGEARTAMEYLRSHNLDEVIRCLRQPVLGICVGQQLLCRHSEEGDTDCIGIFPMDVHRFVPTRHEDKIPQMGWNKIFNLRTPLFNPSERAPLTDSRNHSELAQLTDSRNHSGLAPMTGRKATTVEENSYVYFVHSYYVPLHDEYTIATADFTLPYSAAIHKDNFYATQFHPEKSGSVGENILQNFIDL